MKLEFYRPQNEILRKYIEGYYFISPYPIQELSYYTFPNNYFIVSVNIGSEISISENEIIVSRSIKNKITADFVTRYNKPIKVNYKDAVSEVTLYFKPAGIHYFADDALLWMKHASGVDFNPFPDFYPTMKTLLKIQDRAIQIATLEQYWISKFNQKNFPVLESVLSDLDSDLSITEIASKHHFSRQHLNQLVGKYIGKSPSAYRKIQRFRKAIGKKKSNKTLTGLTYESLFYDQSHMIKDFKELTWLSPNSFFKNVDTEKENIWLFI